MGLTINYQSLLDGVTDSCSLTAPINSSLSETITATRSALARTGAPTATVEVEVSGSASGSASGSLPGQEAGVQQLQELTVSGNTITGNVTIDLTPYQAALENLSFPQNNDITLSSELSKNKIKPSLDSLLGIDIFGNSTHLGDVNGSVLINSDRVIINAKQRLAMVFGKKGVAIASPTRVNIDAGESITLGAYGGSGGLFIGLPNTGLAYEKTNQKQLNTIGTTKGHPTLDQEYEPLVLGIKLANILEDLLFILKSIEGVDAFSPVKFQPTVQAELALLANRIPEMLSSYAYIDGMSHESVDTKLLETIIETQASTPDYVPPPNLTGSFQGQFTITTSVPGGGYDGSGGPIPSGEGLSPISNMIFSGESMGGDPSAYNVGVFNKGMKSGLSGTPGKRGYIAGKVVDISQLTFNGVQSIQRRRHGGKDQNPLGVPYDTPKGGVYKDALFATGLWQAIPGTLRGWIKTEGIGDKLYNYENQNAYGQKYFLLRPADLGGYLKGTQSGTFAELAKAVDRVAQIWASMPNSGGGAGAIQNGSNKRGNYGGQGGKHTAAEVANAIILSRIQHSGKPPVNFPSYYTGRKS